MNIEALHIGQQVRHPVHGIGTVKSLSEHACDIQFSTEKRTVHPTTSGLEPAAPQATVTGLTTSLEQLIRETVASMVDRLGIEDPSSRVSELAPRWRGGRMVIHPVDPTLQTKEVELDQFFHKLTMMRNNLRVLEQKVNAAESISSADRFDWQQYITRCYGSMTTFNLLFKDKESGF